MKYMKHLRKLALLSSLALSFNAYADGTLPLPGVKPPMLLEGNFSDGTMMEADKPKVTLSLFTNVDTEASGELDCTTGTFHKALVNPKQSTIVLDGISYTFQGACYASETALYRELIATDINGTELRLHGSTSISPTTKFNAQVWLKNALIGSVQLIPKK